MVDPKTLKPQPLTLRLERYIPCADNPDFVILMLSSDWMGRVASIFLSLGSMWAKAFCPVNCLRTHVLRVSEGSGQYFLEEGSEGPHRIGLPCASHCPRLGAQCGIRPEALSQKVVSMVPVAVGVGMFMSLCSDA